MVKRPKKEIRIIAIKAATGVELSPGLSTQEIKDYVTSNVYGTSHWPAYRATLAAWRFNDNKQMKLEEAFAALIQHRAWYKNSGVDKRTAGRDKAKFLRGEKVPEDRLRRYLQDSGNWICVQQESWTQIQNETEVS